jgi:hypothetical protein
MAASGDSHHNDLDLSLLGKVAVGVAIACLVFVVFLFLLVLKVSLGSFLAAVGLICCAGVVVGTLVALSFAEEEHEPE